MLKKLSSQNDEIYQLSAFAFQYELTPERLEERKKEKRKEAVWGWMEDDRLTAKLHIVPLEVSVHGKPIKMGGISSVATWPEFRRKGIVRKLLQHALQEMKKEGQVLSYLHPFSIPFYRRFGWEITFDEKEYIIPMHHFKRDWQLDSGMIRRMQNNDVTSIVETIYEKYTKQFNGMLLRDLHWWEHKILSKEKLIAVSYDPQGEPDGYILYEVKKNILEVEELIHLTLASRQRLLHFISNHDSMAKEVKMVAAGHDALPLLLDDPRFEQKVSPYFMARIVDVSKFLQQYPFLAPMGDLTINLEIIDDFVESNSGTYRLESNNKQIYVEKKSKEATLSVSITIQQLASILLGYKRPIELMEIGLIQGEQQQIETLDRIIPQTKPYFADFF
ncbi:MULTISPECIES: GNAT family N-acetyltransferase [unclassified Oceanobacillus]|uniref:GNAT family N-acetyltransferase n=1 Tax=unclassified Oceanobacillus TaxID=2630292 RepID=UPI001BE543AF|nr:MULTISPECIES: GNAT family N-acetyltransferase [unclassified Oceanobacillus]MBT2601280.1 GNAT family N-acetyltransferase [Oceanobacillus sp. ISL-74]MBT2653343.1 GNAT family N-acetyltransferase [Oceanobacillus sp. ISL-73]